MFATGVISVTKGEYDDDVKRGCRFPNTLRNTIAHFHYLSLSSDLRAFRR